MVRGTAGGRLKSDALYLYGYRPQSQGFFAIAPKGKRVAPYLEVRRVGVSQCDSPMAVAMSSRWVVTGLAPLCPDAWFPENMAQAVRNRLAIQLPKVIVPGFYRGLRNYARLFMRKHFVPVSRDQYCRVTAGRNAYALFEWWLARSTYTVARVRELFQLWVDVRQGNLKKADFRCKCFVKTESYESPKHPRAIVSRSDAYKCFSGPWFALIESVVYDSPFFVKHVPVADRAKFIGRLAESGYNRFLASDFSSFELHANKMVQKAVEIQFYRYMLREIPEAAEFLAVHERVATGTQKLDSKHWVFEIPACRMSGETCTSLGNGITNLILVHYVTQVFGGQVMDAVVEGDDGLYVIRGHVPTEAEFRQCGCSVKLECHDDLSAAGFCSMFFVETTEGRVMMRDAREKLVRFGWTMSTWRLGGPTKLRRLLAASGFALAAEVGSCPILWVVAQQVLRETMGVEPLFCEDGYHMFTSRVGVREPTLAVRVAYQQLFDVDIAQQLALEDEIRRMGLNGPKVYEFCYTPARAAMFQEYAIQRRAGQPVWLVRDRTF